MLSVHNLTLDDDAHYFCVATNSAGVVVSSAVRVGVNRPPVVLPPPHGHGTHGTHGTVDQEGGVDAALTIQTVCE